MVAGWDRFHVLVPFNVHTQKTCKGRRPFEKHIALAGCFSGEASVVQSDVEIQWGDVCVIDNKMEEAVAKGACRIGKTKKKLRAPHGCRETSLIETAAR
jgi:hypothetical protein